MSGPSLVSRYRGTVARPPDLRRKDAPEIPATFRPTMLEEPDREEQMWAEVLLNAKPYSQRNQIPQFPGEYCRKALMAPYPCLDSLHDNHLYSREHSVGCSTWKVTDVR